MFGVPVDCSTTTFLPFGPNVVLTVFASLSTPLSIERLASSENLTSLAIFYSPH